MKHVIKLALIVLGVIFAGNQAWAGLPLNNLEGVGGVAFNPLAYPAEGDPLYSIGDTEVISKPRFGTWYARLEQPKIDWGSIGGATTLFKRLEVSEGYQYISWAIPGKDFHKNNIGAKLVLLPENSFDTKFLPEISVGTIYKTTSDKVLRQLGLPTHGSGEDWYAVATKTITQLPLPVVLSAGVLSSEEVGTGVLGFTNERRETAFGNVDVVLPHNFAVGYEFKQGEEYNNTTPIHGNANYWDVHVAWLANKNLTLVLAYTDTGRYNLAHNTKYGLGSGPVLSAQYAF
ncbi:MAG: DUF3034 family protein [Candidatus Omnitrophica bacterium]|nr:DUF3034 family protein [Candidatus Omnitrophota bacterium]